MQKDYYYELWNGRECLGYLYFSYSLEGKYLIIPITSGLQGKRVKVIKLPIKYRLIINDGMDTVIRKVLDVSRKSKYQLNILKTLSSQTYFLENR